MESIERLKLHNHVMCLAEAYDSSPLIEARRIITAERIPVHASNTYGDIPLLLPGYLIRLHQLFATPEVFLY